MLEQISFCCNVVSSSLWCHNEELENAGLTSTTRKFCKTTTKITHGTGNKFDLLSTVPCSIRAFEQEPLKGVNYTVSTSLSYPTVHIDFSNKPFIKTHQGLTFWYSRIDLKAWDFICLPKQPTQSWLPGRENPYSFSSVQLQCMSFLMRNAHTAWASAKKAEAPVSTWAMSEWVLGV